MKLPHLSKKLATAWSAVVALLTANSTLPYNAANTKLTFLGVVGIVIAYLVSQGIIDAKTVTRVSNDLRNIEAPINAVADVAERQPWLGHEIIDSVIPVLKDLGHNTVPALTVALDHLGIDPVSTLVPVPVKTDTTVNAAANVPDIKQETSTQAS